MCPLYQAHGATGKHEHINSLLSIYLLSMPLTLERLQGGAYYAFLIKIY